MDETDGVPPGAGWGGLGSLGKSAGAADLAGAVHDGLVNLEAWAWFGVAGRKLFAYSHSFPTFATWYCAFPDKDIFCGGSGRLARGWLEESKMRLKALKNTCEHLDTRAENFFDYEKVV